MESGSSSIPTSAAKKVLQLNDAVYEVETDPNGYTSVETFSDEDEEEGRDSNEDEPLEFSDLSEEDKSQSDTLKSKFDRMEQECLERGRTIRSLKEQLDASKSKARKLKKENQALKEQIKNLQKSRESEQREETEQLRQQIERLKEAATGDHAAVIQKQEEEIRRLQEQLAASLASGKSEESKKKSTQVDKKELEDLRLQIANLKHELEEKNWEIEMHEKRLNFFNRGGGTVSITSATSGAAGSSSSNSGSGGGESAESLRNQVTLLTRQREESEILEKAIYQVTNSQFVTRDGEIPRSWSVAEISKALMTWNVFSSPNQQADEKSETFLEKIVTAIDVSSKRAEEDLRMYWLSTACMLLHFLRAEMKYYYLDDRSTKPSLIGNFANSLKKLIASILARLLDRLYNVGS